MTIEIKVPVLPESVADATIVAWHKKPGDAVKRDENLVDIETDKVVLEVPAVQDGVLKTITKLEGTKVLAQEVIGILEEGVAAASAAPAAKTIAAPSASPPAALSPAPAKPTAPAADVVMSPAVRRLVSEQGIDPSNIKGTGKEGRVTKADVLQHQQSGAAPAANTPVASSAAGSRIEQRVPMSRLRARVAERLVAAQHNAAILTTFNEINMQAVMDIRARFKESFEKEHGVRLGFMSFFTRAVVDALKNFPNVNASIDGTDIIYHGYFDIGIAVSTERGLVVPIVRDADALTFADIEKAVAANSKKARDNQITLEEITGGTFTITNGGVFGSLLSTPIINPPQSAILGMHKIEERAVVENGQIVIRPMMYVAMSYDHRIIDGKDSVGFLVAVKQFLEDPARMLLEL